MNTTFLSGQENDQGSHQHDTQAKWHRDQCTQQASNPTNGTENTESIKSIHFTVTQEQNTEQGGKEKIICVWPLSDTTKSQSIKMVAKGTPPQQGKNVLLPYWTWCVCQNPALCYFVFLRQDLVMLPRMASNPWEQVTLLPQFPQCLGVQVWCTMALCSN